MMPIDFPASPATNQVYSYNNRSWTWNGTVWLSAQPISSLGNICSSGRLTVSSGTPVPTTDVSTSTLYYTPYNGNMISLYDGTSWSINSFTERTLALGTLVSGKNYDVFMYNNSGTLTLESLVWTSDTARATALVLTDGVYLKTGALTRRYLGTFRTTSTTTTADSLNNRLVWNVNNQVERAVKMDTYTYYAYTGHTYTTAAWRAWRADTGLIIGYVVGLDRGISVGFGCASSGAITSQAAAWDGGTPGYDSVDVVSRAGRTYSTRGSVLGYHYITMMQYGTSSTYIQGLLEGTFWC
jgi:hypothetical protein